MNSMFLTHFSTYILKQSFFLFSCFTCILVVNGKIYLTKIGKPIPKYVQCFAINVSHIKKFSFFLFFCFVVHHYHHHRIVMFFFDFITFGSITSLSLQSRYCRCFSSIMIRMMMMMDKCHQKKKKRQQQQQYNKKVKTLWSLFLLVWFMLFFLSPHFFSVIQFRFSYFCFPIPYGILFSLYDNL